MEGEKITTKGVKSKTTTIVFVLLLFFSALLFSMISVSPAYNNEPIHCLEDDEPFVVEISAIQYYSEYVTSAGSDIPIKREFGPKFCFYISSWDDAWQDRGLWYLVEGNGDIVTWWGVEVDRYISDDPEWEWYVEVPIPEMLMPLFAKPGPWQLEFWMTNKAIWLIEYDVQILAYYFNAVEASIWDNLFAPYYMTWGGASLWVFELNSGFTLAIPAPLFLILVLVIIILIIKFVIPLWMAIPSAADTKKKRIGGVVVGRSFKGG